MHSDIDIEIPGYEIKRLVGRGGMAEVYLAVQHSLQREVAIKILLPALSAEVDFASRFEREATTVASLQHPNIIKIFDTGQHLGRYFIAMEYLGSNTLKDLILRGMSPELAVSFLLKLGSALEYAHTHGVIHRDIKPANVLLYGDSEPVLSDFGISRLVNSSSTLTATGVAMGSPRYMSPEQACGNKVDLRTDLYALGVVFHEMLTGHLPFESEDSLVLMYKHVHEPPPRLPVEVAHYQWVIDRLMAKTPENRFADAGALIQALSGVVVDAGLLGDKTVPAMSEIHGSTSGFSIHVVPTQTPREDDYRDDGLAADSVTVGTAGDEAAATADRPHQRFTRKWRLAGVLAGLLLLILVGVGAFVFFIAVDTTETSMPGDIPTIITALQQQLRQGDFAQAERLLQRGLARDALNPRLLQLAEKVRLGLEQKRWRKRAEIMSSFGNQALQQHDYALALEQVQALNSLGRKYPDARQQAKILQDALRTGLLQQIQAMLKRDELQKAQALAQEGQQLFPAEKVFRSSYQAIQKRRREKQQMALQKYYRQAEKNLQENDIEALSRTLDAIEQLVPGDGGLGHVTKQLEASREEFVSDLLAKAESAIASHRYEDASVLLQQAKRVGVAHPDVTRLEQLWQRAAGQESSQKQFALLLKRAQLAMNEQDFDTALAQAHKAQQLNVDPQQVQSLLIEVASAKKNLARKHRQQQLLQQIENALAQQQFDQARSFLAELKHLNAPTKQIERISKRIAQAVQWSQTRAAFDDSLQQAQNYLQQEQWQKALDATSKALAVIPGHPDAKRLQNRIKVTRENRRQELEQQFYAALSKDELNRAQTLLQGLQKQDVGAKRLHQYQQELTENQSRVDAVLQFKEYMNDAQGDLSKGNWLEARAAIDEALLIYPENPMALTLRKKILSAESAYFTKEYNAILDLVNASEFDTAMQHWNQLKKTILGKDKELSDLHAIIVKAEGKS